MNPEASVVATEGNSRKDSPAQLESYCEIAGSDTGRVERLLGKPSKIENRGKSSYAWVYEDLGVTLYVTTYRPTNVQIVATVFQQKGTLVDSIKISDPEEVVVDLAGQVIISSQGERMAKFTRQPCYFTVTLVDGKIAKAQIGPIGREDL